MSILRRLVLVLAVTALGLAAARRSRPAPGVVLIDPIAPPLTRIESLGDRPLGPTAAPPQPGARPAGPPPPGQPPGPDPRGHSLRVAVEADASAIARVLGPERVAWALASRESLSADIAETATWQALVQSLRQPG